MKNITEKKPPIKLLAIKLRSYFFTGILVTAPVIITLWIVISLIRIFDNLVTPLIPSKFNPNIYLPYEIPGLGFLVLISFLVIIGFLTANFFGRWVVKRTELILETMRNNGFEAETVVLAGGATRSNIWLQIHADVSNLPLTLTKVPDAPALGSAILAAVGSGAFSDIGSAARKMVQVDRVIEPNPESHGIYQPFYQSYREHYLAMKKIRNKL